MKVYAILVLYNMDLNDSPSLKSLLEYQQLYPIEIIVCDNSDNFNRNNENNFPSKKFKYISMKGNHGLSKAYNKAITEINKLSFDSCIFFVDQDTVINFDLISKGKSLLKKNNNLNIIAPQVKDVKGLLSPFKMTFVGGRRLRHYKKNTKNMSFINSGLCIRAIVFKNINYDENLFLDLIDIAFIRKYKKEFNIDTIFVNNVIIHQEFSGTTHVNLSLKLKRFYIYIKDFRKFYNDNILMKLKCEIILFLYSLKLCIKYRNSIFLKKLYSRI